MSPKMWFRLFGLSCLLIVAGFVLPALTQDAKKGKKYALLVGVTEYKGTKFPTLNYTENDVEKLADVLTGAGFDRVRVLTNKRGKTNAADAPTAANIRKAIDELVEDKGKRDTVLIGFAGHGANVKVDDPDEKGKPKTYSFFCPFDASLLNVSYSAGRSKFLVNLKLDLFDKLEHCGARNKFVLIDACRNEFKAESATRSLGVDKETIPGGVGVLFSCSKDEVAWESKKLKHGIFFHFVLEGLRGKAKNDDGEVTWPDLVAYATRQVERQVGTIVGEGASQTPHTLGNVRGAPILVPARRAVAKGDKDRLGKDYPGKEPIRPSSQELALENVRFTHGILGSPRESNEFLPGDVVCLLFDVQGMRVKDDGQVLYSMGFEIAKKGDKGIVQKLESKNLTAVNSLGGSNFPSVAYWPIPRNEQAPGSYTITVAVTDRVTKKSTKFTKDFEVTPTKFGFIQLRYTTLKGDPNPPVAVAGQRLTLHYSLVGFEMDKQENTSNVTLSIRVLDEKGKQSRQVQNRIQADAKTAPGLMTFDPFPIELNRAGKFKVEFVARCNISGKEAKERIDLTVFEPRGGGNLPRSEEVGVSNVRFTHGILGDPRESARFLPGDVVCLFFDVQGMKVKDDGQVLYSMGFEITKKGQKNAVQKKEPQDLTAVNTLGGGNFPSVAYWPIPRDDQAPGAYTITISVTDRVTKKATKFTKDFEVTPTKLGYIQLRYTTFGGDPSPPVALAGQRLALHYSLVGFDHDKNDKNTNVTITIRILDEKGKPTLAKAITNDIKSDAKAAPGIMLFNPFPIELNRAGKFKVELTAGCNVSGKTTKEVLDLTVIQSK